MKVEEYDNWEHKDSSKSNKELEGEEPKLQVVDFDKLLQWEKEKLINKACVWLVSNISNYISTVKGTDFITLNCELFDDFEKYMEGKK